MLSSLVREHQAKQAARRDIQERRRKEAIISASNVTKALVENLNNSPMKIPTYCRIRKVKLRQKTQVAIAYNNEKKLDAEAKQLQANAALFAKQSMQWLQLIENFNQALKELGDVENWSKSLESDMQTIASALEYAYKDTG